MSDEPMIMELHGLELRLFNGEDLYKVKYNKKGKAKWTRIENSVSIKNKTYSYDRIQYKMFHGTWDIDGRTRMTTEMYSSLQFMIESNYPSCLPT